MSTPMHDSDRSIVRAALDEIRAAPGPPDRAPLGCTIALPGFAILLVFPLVGRMLGIGGGVAAVVLGLGIALLVVGLGLWFAAGGLVRGHFTAAAEAALRRLEDPAETDRETLLRAATLLLVHAHATYGPTTSAGFDFARARTRLGERIELVTAVERVLLDEEAIYPVFTGGEEGGGDENGDPR